jgi:hypothetical protein
MKEIQSTDSKDERRTLIGLATDPVLLKRVAETWDPKKLPMGTLGLIIGWMVDYWKLYKKCPRFRAIEDYSRHYFEKHGENEGLEKALTRLRRSLRVEAEMKDKLDTEHLAAITPRLFRREQLYKMGIRGEGVNGKTDEVIKLIENFEPITLSHAEAITAADIKPKLVRWLWPGFLARGEISMLDGLPGEGKSQLLIDVAARVTQGRDMPPEATDRAEERPRNVLILSKEDSWEHTIVPRLMAAKADLKRIIKPPKDDIRFPRDIEMITGQMRDYRIRLVIIDPILAFLGTEKIDANTESHVRDFLNPLLDATRSCDASTALIRHFRKDATGAIHRGLGSQAWTAVCRLQHVVGRIGPKEPATLAVSKCNIARKAPSFRYAIIEEEVFAPGEVRGKNLRIKTSKVEWIGPCETSANAISAAAGLPGRRPTKCDEAVEMLLELTEDGKTMDADQCEEKVRAECRISGRTYDTAKKMACVLSRKTKNGWEVYRGDATAQQ